MTALSSFRQKNPGAGRLVRLPAPGLFLSNFLPGRPAGGHKPYLPAAASASSSRWYSSKADHMGRIFAPWKVRSM